MGIEMYLLVNIQKKTTYHYRDIDIAGNIQMAFYKVRLVQPPARSRRHKGVLKTIIPKPRWEIITELATFKIHHTRYVQMQVLRGLVRRDDSTIEEDKLEDKIFEIAVRDLELQTWQRCRLFPETINMPLDIAYDYIREKIDGSR